MIIVVLSVGGRNFSCAPIDYFPEEAYRPDEADSTSAISCKFYYFTSSVAKGPKFRPQNTKGAEQIVWGRVSLGPDFWQNYQKRAEKGPNFFLVLFCTKIVIFLAETYSFPLLYSIFTFYFAL
jgi:hypothetical protein